MDGGRTLQILVLFRMTLRALVGVLIIYQWLRSWTHLTVLRVNGGDGVELCVVVESLGESADGRLLALPLHPAVQHPLAATLQTPAAVALDLKGGHVDLSKRALCRNTHIQIKLFISIISVESAGVAGQTLFRSTGLMSGMSYRK